LLLCVQFANDHNILDLDHGALTKELLEYAFDNIHANRPILEYLVHRLYHLQTEDYNHVGLLDGLPKMFVERVQLMSLIPETDRVDCFDSCYGEHAPKELDLEPCEDEYCYQSASVGYCVRKVSPRRC